MTESQLTDEWVPCTPKLAHTTPEALNLLQVRRLRQRMPGLNTKAGYSVREINLLVIASFLGNVN